MLVTARRKTKTKNRSRVGALGSHLFSLSNKRNRRGAKISIKSNKTNSKNISKCFAPEERGQQQRRLLLWTRWDLAHRIRRAIFELVTNLLRLTANSLENIIAKSTPPCVRTCRATISFIIFAAFSMRISILEGLSTSHLWYFANKSVR